MKQVVKVRILPTGNQAAALQATLRTCNEAASWLSTVMRAERVHRKHEVQKRFYTISRGGSGSRRSRRSG